MYFSPVYLRFKNLEIVCSWYSHIQKTKESQRSKILFLVLTSGISESLSQSELIEIVGVGFQNQCEALAQGFWSQDLYFDSAKIGRFTALVLSEFHLICQVKKSSSVKKQSVKLHKIKKKSAKYFFKSFKKNKSKLNK